MLRAAHAVAVDRAETAALAAGVRQTGRVPRYAVAARRARAESGRPVPPWHAADLLDDDPGLHAGESVVSLCGEVELQVFALDWDGLIASNGCRQCQHRAGLSAPMQG